MPIFQYEITRYGTRYGRYATFEGALRAWNKISNEGEYILLNRGIVQSEKTIVKGYENGKK